MVGPGAGRFETGFSLLTDILAIHQKYNNLDYSRVEVATDARRRA